MELTSSLHKSVLSAEIPAATGDGLTVMEKVVAEALQLLALGTAIILAITGILPELNATNGLISPVPDAGRPIEF